MERCEAYFRGKIRHSGRMHEGFLFIDENDRCYISGGNLSGIELVEVEPKTVDKYTGVIATESYRSKELFGNLLVFGGDVIKVTLPNGEKRIGYIEDSGQGYWRAVDRDGNHFLFGSFSNIEVIGSIYEMEI